MNTAKCNYARPALNLKRLSLLLALLTGPLIVSAAPPELEGIYVESDKALFVLVNPDTAATSHWLSLGQEFEGYTLKAFQSDADTLVLTKESMDYRIKLRASKVKYAATALTGTIEIGNGGSVKVQRATLVFDEETTFPINDGLALAIKPTLRPDGTILYQSHFDQTGPDGKKQVLSNPTVVALPGKAFDIRVGDLGYSLTP